MGLLCLGAGPLSRLAADTGCPDCGDVNCDGAVDIIDALMIGQQVTGMRLAMPCSVAADVTADGSVDIDDALQIAQYANGRRGPFVCAAVIRELVPPVVGTNGGERVRVRGGNFRPGASIALDTTAVATTRLDCGTLEITAPRRRPGNLSVTVTNPDSRAVVGSVPLEIEGAFRNVTTPANLVFVPPRGDGLLPIAGGVAVGDYDHDGQPDIFVPSYGGANGLFRNRGDGTFVNVAAAAGVEDPHGKNDGACFGDYDNDGNLDLYVTGFGANHFYRNNGNGTFTDITGPAGVADDSRGTGCSWGDYDRDGFLDLYVSNHLEESDRSVFVTRKFDGARRPDRLFHNRGNGTFEDVTAQLGDRSLVTGAGFGAGFVDYDNDGDPDLYLVNDFGREIQGNVLWRNDGPKPDGWRFTDVSKVSATNVAMFGMGLAIGDYDGDGFFDFYVTNIGRNLLLRARGDGTFEERTDQAGVARELVNAGFSVTWGDAFLDYDNDGFLDLYVVSGYLDSDPLINQLEQPNALFHSRGNGTFEDVSNLSGADDPGIGRGLAVADFNHDGFLDMVLVNLGQGVVLLENTGRGAGHWLEIDTVGTRSNRNGVGARITATVGARRLMREVGAGTSHMSQHAFTAHFGIGAASIVDLLEVRWPSGARQTLRNVAADQRLVVTEP